MIGLTAEQLRLLNFLRAVRRSGEPTPTYAEIGAGLGIKSKSSVHQQLTQLEKRGYITRIKNTHGSIRLVGSPWDLPEGTKEKLDAFCAEHNLSQGDVIATALTLLFLQRRNAA